MSAILNIKFDKLNKICSVLNEAFGDESKVVVIANFNTEEQLVISGDPELVSKAGAQAKAAGAKVIPFQWAALSILL